MFLFVEIQFKTISQLSEKQQLDSFKVVNVLYNEAFRLTMFDTLGLSVLICQISQKLKLFYEFLI